MELMKPQMSELSAGQRDGRKAAPPTHTKKKKKGRGETENSRGYTGSKGQREWLMQGRQGFI